MPLYDYQCEECERIFEIKQSFTAEPIAECPSCGLQARRLFHPVGIIFKGSGWYVNDHGRQRKPLTKDSENSGADSDSQSKPSDSSVGSANGGSAEPEPVKQEIPKQETKKPETGS